MFKLHTNTLRKLLSRGHVDLTIGIDVSGSVLPATIQSFVKDVHNIASTLESFSIKMFKYTNKVFDVADFNQENVDALLSYDVYGGGSGSSISSVYEFMKSTGHVPCTFINVVDSYTYEWGDADYCDTVFVILDASEGETIEAPFGLTLYYAPIK